MNVKKGTINARPIKSVACAIDPVVTVMKNDVNDNTNGSC
jgi:hypothetical protein